MSTGFDKDLVVPLPSPHLFIVLNAAGLVPLGLL